MKRNHKYQALIFSALIAVTVIPGAVCAGSRPNILFITVDDMNCDSVGVYGCKVPEITPNR